MITIQLDIAVVSISFLILFYVLLKMHMKLSKTIDILPKTHKDLERTLNTNKQLTESNKTIQMMKEEIKKLRLILDIKTMNDALNREIDGK